MTGAPRIGVFGGTFDPIHVGHLEAAAASRQQLSLDRILLLPARTPPHRSVEPRASVFHRFAMIALAANSREDMVASDLELRRDGPSYTALTLEALQGEGFTASQLFFIIGGDAFADIATWYDYPRLLGLANFVVVSRPGAPSPKSDRIPGPQSLDPAAPTSILVVEAKTPDVSSTDIRRRVAGHMSIEGLVPSPVAEHIRRHHLYVPAAGIM